MEHNTCSEGFYKKEIRENINSEPSKTAEERHKMIQLLQRFEDESQQEDPLDSDDDDDSSDLMSRFASIDISSVSSEVLWSLLKPDERDKFLKALQNPSSDLAKKLLSSDLLEAEIQQPWWKLDDMSNKPANREIAEVSRIPDSLVSEMRRRYQSCLSYLNSVAYAYITRHLGTSPLCYLQFDFPEYHEAIRIFTRMVPFLTDRKSTTLYPDLLTAVTDLWAGFELGSVSSELFALLLEDTAELLSPMKVIEESTPSLGSSSISDYSSHPHSKALRVLSDIYHLFSLRGEDMGSSAAPESKRSQHVTQKLVFYSGYVLSTPSGILNGLVANIRMVARRYEVEMSGHHHHHHDHDDDVLGAILNCGNGGGSDLHFHLRIASIFIILVGATGGALFPILAKRSTWLHVPKSVFDFAKYFGSGVIIATAFVHLLSHGLEALESPCLSEKWHEFHYGMAFCLLSIFAIFIIEIVAFRVGTSKLKKLGRSHDAHGHGPGSHAAHGPEGSFDDKSKNDTNSSDVEVARTPTHPFQDSMTTQIIGVAILEFGVVLHSILIGLTLAVDENFKILFIVILFHQTFEGLGIGARLAHLELAQKYRWIPMAGAIIYGLTTPIGIAAGLGVRSTYNPGSATASIVTGVMDSISAGILVYTGLVELFAHEFLFNKEMMNASNGRLAYAIGCMCLGCALMSLLGRWA
ncbi:hypothetical protein CVT24_006294 [Panaeolus cyanescens]|uniref:Uncharacterized protein n=1 Tax=Panaeolus cyanescens TaxID=181874 RepID=A0A409V8K0_9AGAR|nr:hypothetical protein CVT24_006294 [Panaeolus cyanescens]